MDFIALIASFVLHSDHLPGPRVYMSMRSLLCLSFLLATSYLVGMNHRQQLPCPCYACQGSTLPRDPRTVAAHMQKQRDVEAFYLHCSVPSAHLHADVLRDAPTGAASGRHPGPAFPMSDDADPVMTIEDGDDYVDGNPIRELPGWAECISVRTQHSHARRRPFSHMYTRTPTHMARTPTGGPHLPDTR